MVAPTLRGEQQAIWVIRAGQGGAQAGTFLKNGLVSMGFGERQDLTGRDRDTIFSELVAVGRPVTRR